MYGIELESVNGISVGMNIGTKMVLREVVVARGLLLMEPRSVQVLGGKIDDLHQRWKGARKDALKARANAGNG